MTNEQKTQIKQFRQSGYGYASIAESFSLTKGQVSAFCRRNDLLGTRLLLKERPNIDCCRNCGKPWVQAPGRKPVKFCSAPLV